jgi:hypothetical protein
MWICGHPYYQPNLHHNKHTFVCFHKQYHNPQYWDVSFGKHYFQNVPNPYCFHHFLAMINVPFKMHLAPHVPMETFIMVYNSFETCMTLAMTYVPIKMCLAFHVHFKTLAMSYILVTICLALHVPFGTLAMVYILIKMHLAPHVPFKTLVMTYIPS